VTATSSDKLTSLQRAVLQAMMQAEPRVYLSGGAALAGFHLRHRTTIDLDFFVRDAQAVVDALAALRTVAARLQGTLTVRQQTPTFVRAVVECSAEGLVVDIVHEGVPQLHEDKPIIDGVRVDPLDEILVNKLTALVGRQEERDLVDVWFIEQTGLYVEGALAAAERKDGGCTPATLAWLLSSFPVPADDRLPSPLTRDRLLAWRDALVLRLTRAARPPDAVG
jgi:hypothetical protein